MKREIDRPSLGARDIIQLSFKHFSPEWATLFPEIIEDGEENELLGLRGAVKKEIFAYLGNFEEDSIHRPWVVTTRYSSEQAKLLLEEASQWGISIPDVLVNIVERQTSPGDYRLTCLARRLVQLLGLQDERVREKAQRRREHIDWFHRLAEEMELGEFRL